jgi:hypothetical protein
VQVVLVVEPRAKLEAVAHVRVAVTGVVDVDVVTRAVVEAIEVRSAGRILEPGPAGGDRDLAWSALRREGPDVSVVGEWIG